MKNILLFVTICFTVQFQNLMGQTPTCEWALDINSLTGSVYSSGKNIKIDNNGNIYVKGEIMTDSGPDIKLTKLSSNGQVLWSKIFGGIGYDDLGDIFFDYNNNVYITGYFTCPSISLDNYTIIGNNSIVIPFPTITDYFVAKLDNSGNVIWVKSSGTNQNNNWSVPYICYNFQNCQGIDNVTISVDINGFIYMAGSTKMSNLTINNTTIQNTLNKCFLIKFDSTGNLIWTKITGSTGGLFKQIETDNLGNTYILGSFSGATIALDLITLTNSYFEDNTDLFIAKFNSQGNVLWGKKIGALYNNKYIESFDVNDNGEVAIGGRFGGSITIDNQILNSIGNWDGFIAKFDSNGNVIWKKAIGGYRTDYVWGVKIDNSGNIYGIGDYNSLSINLDNFNFSLNNNDDIFAVKYNNLGNAIWAINASGYGTDNGLCIDYDNFANFIIQGKSQNSQLPFCNTTFNSNGGIINFITKYYEGNLSNDEYNYKNEISVYPNPAKSQININFNNITDLNGGTLKVINSLGQEVATTPITTSGTQSIMQLATWGGSGMYFVQIINPQGIVVDVKKIILQ